MSSDHSKIIQHINKTISQKIQAIADEEGISFLEASKKVVLKIGDHEIRPMSADKLEINIEKMEKE